jgi:hypothetical protein
VGAICFPLLVTARFGVLFIWAELSSSAVSGLRGLFHFGLRVHGLILCRLVFAAADFSFSFSFPALGQGKLPFLFLTAGFSPARWSCLSLVKFSFCSAQQ